MKNTKKISIFIMVLVLITIPLFSIVKADESPEDWVTFKPGGDSYEINGFTATAYLIRVVDYDYNDSLLAIINVEFEGTAVETGNLKITFIFDDAVSKGQISDPVDIPVLKDSTISDPHGVLIYFNEFAEVSLQISFTPESLFGITIPPAVYIAPSSSWPFKIHFIPKSIVQSGTLVNPLIEGANDNALNGRVEGTLKSASLNYELIFDFIVISTIVVYQREFSENGFLMPAHNVDDFEFTLKFTELPQYEIDKMIAEWSGEGSAGWTVDGDEESFLRLTDTDGNIIDPSNYSVSSGSTIITLKRQFLETLDMGSHSFIIEFTSGIAVSELVISESDDDVPPTGDNSYFVVWAIMFIVSSFCLLLFIIRQFNPNTKTI
ncbi:MAG: hypothetical protein LBC71_04870 [Oscillospiraceae bacterium]|nr:hypothetical protein [Oscillospiraceae bacterium]